MTQDRGDGPEQGDGSHYFEDPTVASDPVTVDVTLPDTAFTMETDTGVFSRGHLDAGTSLLLRADAAIAPTGALLDLGAGTGAIAMTMARRSPDATVWAVDVNARALELCRRNAVSGRAEAPRRRFVAGVARPRGVHDRAQGVEVGLPTPGRRTAGAELSRPGRTGSRDQTITTG